MAADDRALQVGKAPSGSAISLLAVSIHDEFNVIDAIGKGKLDEARLNRTGDDSQALFEVIRKHQEDE